jgi:DNA-binding LacI/PurR family transcriptional regulator
MKKQKSSINDVAKSAGVSIATVSHVINGTRFVSDETAQRVKKEISNLNYMPSAIARGLASKESKIIGAVFSDISNPFFTSVYKGLECILTAQGYEVILANTGELSINQEIVLRTMFSRQIDGLIIAPTGGNSELLHQIIRMGIPVVMIDRSAPVKNVSLVELDNVSASYLATAHLIEDGHKKIGIVLGLPDVSTTTTRLEGYSIALNEFQIPHNPEFVAEGQSSMETGYRSVRSLMELSDPPTAIFTMNNMMTAGALHAFRDLGLRCPIDVGLVGFDDHDWGDIFTPPLTVIRQPTYEMGIRAAKILINNMKNGRKTHVRLDGELVIRGSCSVDCQKHFLENIPRLFDPLEGNNQTTPANEKRSSGSNT